MGSVRRAVAIRAILLATLAAATACTSAASQPVPQPPRVVDARPNIVFVLADDLSTDLVRYMPHVNALMESGASLRNYFVVDSLCCPSRAAIFTGQYPHNNGVYTNNLPSGGYGAFNQHGDAAKTFAVGLHRAGYRTAFMGKYLNQYSAKAPAARGWDDWFGVDTRDGYAEYNYQANDNGDLNGYGDQPQDYLTTVLQQKAVQFIQDSAATGRPFALEVSTFAPHAPSVAAPPDRDTFPYVTAPRGPAYDQRPTDPPSWLASQLPLTPDDIARLDSQYRKRVESVQAIDRLIGALEQTLAYEHKLDNTYFVFSSDNGFHMGQYRLRAGKQTAFDTDIRVPLLVAGPGIRAGLTIDAMTSSIDLAPTFLAMAGARPTDEPDGVSLLDLLHGKPAPADWQRGVLVEHRGPVNVPTDPDMQPLAAGDPPTYEAIRAANWLYVEYVDGEREYHDLRQDPYELHNTADQLSTARLAQLHADLVALSSCRGVAECQRAARLPAVGAASRA
jgi:arylsulfatase A-like enzyme